jgi:hypothetical protein
LQILDTMVTDLTFAVLPIDDFTGERPLGKIKIYFNHIKYESATNSSGYYLFLNLQDALLDSGNVLTFESVEQYYQEKSIIFSKDDITTNNLVFQINLVPSGSYPFTNDKTLIKGTIMTEISTNGEVLLKPIVGANVELGARNLNGNSDDNGVFVFYFKNLREEDIIVEDKKNFINMGGTNIFDLLITSQNYNPIQIANCKAEMYKTTVISTQLLEEI